MSRREILQEYAAYAREVETRSGKRARTALVKPILQLFAGEGKDKGKDVDEGTAEGKDEGKDVDEGGVGQRATQAGAE